MYNTVITAHMVACIVLYFLMYRCMQGCFQIPLYAVLHNRVITAHTVACISYTRQPPPYYSHVAHRQWLSEWLHCSTVVHMSHAATNKGTSVLIWAVGLSCIFATYLLCCAKIQSTGTISHLWELSEAPANLAVTIHNTTRQGLTHSKPSQTQLNSLIKGLWFVALLGSAKGNTNTNSQTQGHSHT